MKILMVCLGNICRSPLAEGIMKEKILKHYPEAIVDSAGTGGWHVNQPPDNRSIVVASKYGINISQQRARKIELLDFDRFDYIFTMDHDVHRDVLKLAHLPHYKSKVHLLLRYADHETTDSVPDPYYGSDAEFEEVYNLINNACSCIVSKLGKPN